MKTATRWSIPTIKPRTVGLLILLLFAVLLVTQLVGPARERRDRGIQVMRAEAVLLAPFPGSQLTRKIERNEPFSVLILEDDYSLNATCADLQQYYAGTAPANGWSLVEPVGTIHDQFGKPPRDELHSAYHKEVAGYAIDLSVGCTIDQSQGQGYVLSMHSS